MPAKKSATKKPVEPALPSLAPNESFACKLNDFEDGTPELVIVRKDGTYTFGKPEIYLSAVATALNSALTVPALKKEEIYAGVLIVAGKIMHHVILLAGDTSTPWDKAAAWAKKQGGELPTRKEQALLFANAAGEFKQEWYWSGEQHAANESYAWVQSFTSGHQNNDRKDLDYRARAVRRVTI